MINARKIVAGSDGIESTIQKLLTAEQTMLFYRSLPEGGHHNNEGFSQPGTTEREAWRLAHQDREQCLEASLDLFKESIIKENNIYYQINVTGQRRALKIEDNNVKINLAGSGESDHWIGFDPFGSEDSAKLDLLKEKLKDPAASDPFTRRGILQASGNCTLNSLMLAVFGDDDVSPSLPHLFKAFYETHSGQDIRQLMDKKLKPV